MKNFVLCISEMEPTLLTKWMSRLPNFAALKERGLTGTTKYSYPFLLTPQMWATITTGVTAGSHGVFDYWQRDDSTGKFSETNGGDIEVERIWEILDDSGIRTCIANVPHTYPPSTLKHGILFSGQDAPGAHSSIATSKQAYQTITKHLGRYHHKDIFPGGQSRPAYAKKIVDETEWQGQLFDFLVREFDAEFMMCYASGAAMAQHYFWADMEGPASPESCPEVLFETYLALDGILGRLCEVASADTNIWVISECGAGPIKSGIDINCWLEQAGFLKFKDQTPKTGTSIDRRILNAVRMGAQRFLPKQTFHLINRPAIRRFIHDRLATSQIDWTQTRAYHHGKGEGAIYLNLQGRDPHGVVPIEEASAIMSEIQDRLSALCDPTTGQPVVEAVHRGKDLYDGPFRHRAPDLIVEWVDFAYMPNESAVPGSEIFVPRMREYMSWPTTGSHRTEGVFMASGPQIEQGNLSKCVDLLDLAPTWLAATKTALPSHFEGSVVQEILKLEQPRT